MPGLPGLPPPAAGQEAELEHDRSPGSAFRKKILYGLLRSIGLDHSSSGGFCFDSRVCTPERAPPEATGALGAESRAVALPAFLPGCPCLSAVSVTASEMYKKQPCFVSQLPFGQNAFTVELVWQPFLGQEGSQV